MMAVPLFKQIVEDPDQTDAAMLTAAYHELLRAARGNGPKTELHARLLLHAMGSDRRVTLTATAFDLVLPLCATRFALAQFLLTEMAYVRLTPSAETHRIALTALARRRRFDEMGAWLRLALSNKHGLRAELVARQDITALLVGYARCGRASKVEEWTAVLDAHFPTLGADTADLPLLRLLLEVAARAGRLGQARLLLDRLVALQATHPEASQGVGGRALLGRRWPQAALRRGPGSLSDALAPNAAEQWFARLLAVAPGPPGRHYNAIIAAYLQTAQPAMARAWFQWMGEAGVAPTATSYRLLLQSCRAPDGTRLDAPQRVWRAMVADGLVPDAATHEQMATTLAALGDDAAAAQWRARVPRLEADA